MAVKKGKPNGNASKTQAPAPPKRVGNGGKKK